MLKSLAHILFLTVSANADLEEETASYQIPAITAIDEALTEYHPDFLDSDNAEQRYVINMPLQSPSCGQITPLSYAVVMSCQESYKFIPHTKKLVAKLLRMGANPFVFTHFSGGFCGAALSMPNATDGSAISERANNLNNFITNSIKY